MKTRVARDGRVLRPTPSLLAARGGASRLDHHLERLAIGHRAVAIGDAVEVDRAVEHLARLDPAVEDVRQELADVGADRCRPAADDDVAEERRLGSWNRLV